MGGGHNTLCLVSVIGVRDARVAEARFSLRSRTLQVHAEAAQELKDLRVSLAGQAGACQTSKGLQNLVGVPVGNVFTEKRVDQELRRLESTYLDDPPSYARVLKRESKYTGDHCATAADAKIAVIERNQDDRER
ncbi:hypothetical protein K438DRAFT_1777537 [Mycena galopus ATCC 62051]|nr:hypothetical protein K438DRAFT_1777537 [Mycena galopus ATCC 62051]